MERQRSNSWVERRRSQLQVKGNKKYVVLCADAMKPMVENLLVAYPDRFKYVITEYKKYNDGTDDINILGFSPENEIAGEEILFFASFHSNDVTLSQFSVLIVLLQSFIESLTIVLPFYPVATNERVDLEGHVATANTYSMLLSNLPSVGKPTRIMLYDLHTLQNRFYFHSSTVPSLHTAIPLLLARLKSENITAIAFPDDGAAKRFGRIFKTAGFDEIIVCGKKRDGDKRIVTILDGDCRGKEVIIVDDLVQTGGTLYECASTLLKFGALKVHCYVTHGVFPNACWKNFCKGGSKAIFQKFFLTDSYHIVNDLPRDDCFEILNLIPQIVKDLDSY